MRIISVFLTALLDSYFYAKIERYRKSSLAVQVLFKKTLSTYLQGKNSARNTHRYVLECWASRKIGRHNAHPEVYCETQLGILLCVQDMSEGTPKSLPIAVIGFEKPADYLVVTQVEEMKGTEKYLSPLNWEKLLYDMVCMFGQELGAREVRVVPPDLVPNNPFGTRYSGPELPGDVSKRIADMIVRRFKKVPETCGFGWDDCTSTRVHVLQR